MSFRYYELQAIKSSVRVIERGHITEMFAINLWINEERYTMLNSVGLAGMAKDAFAGMKLLSLRCTEEQKDRLLKLYPQAKFDSATTRSIELLPAEAKDKMFNLAIKKADLDIISDFLNEVGQE